MGMKVPGITNTNMGSRREDRVKGLLVIALPSAECRGID